MILLFIHDTMIYEYNTKQIKTAHKSQRTRIRHVRMKRVIEMDYEISKDPRPNRIWKYSKLESVYRPMSRLPDVVWEKTTSFFSQILTILGFTAVKKM